MDCLKMLGSHSIDNYTEEFIQKLYDEYGSVQSIETLQNREVDKFIQLADLWPKFPQNSYLITALTALEADRFGIDDQSRLLRITTHKNLVLPRFF